MGKGVCGTSWEKKQTLLVPDVEKFPGHISCSSDSKSEIVVPVMDEFGNVILVMDIDSNRLNDFDETDKIHLEEVGTLISKIYKKRDA